MIEVKSKTQRRRAILGNAGRQKPGAKIGTVEHALRTLRVERRLTMAELAKRAGVAAGTISQYECGVSRAGAKVTELVCSALHASKPVSDEIRESLISSAFARTRNCYVDNPVVIVVSAGSTGLQGPSPCASEMSSPKRLDAAGVYRRVSLTDGGEG